MKQQEKEDGLDPAQDACLKTKCGTTKLFCLCLPDQQLNEYKAQLAGSNEFQTGFLNKAQLQSAKDFLADDAKNFLGVKQLAPPGHPLQLMLELRLTGRSPQAEKELSNLRKLAQAPKGRGELEAQSLKLATKFIDLVCPLRLDDLNLPVIEKHKTLPLQYGKRIKNGFVEWFSVGDYDGCSLLQALSTYLEVDLAEKFYANLAFKPKELGQSSGTSTAWHIANRNRGVQQDICEDNVYRYEVVNALDDPAIQSVLLFVWSLTDDAICKRPKPLAGYLRSEFECTIYRFVAHLDNKTSICNGFRLVRANINRPPPSFYKIAAEIDDASLKESTRIGNENFYVKFRSHLTDARPIMDLQKRIKEGPRRAVYDAVQKQLARALAKKPSRLQRLGKLCCSACRS